jgi:hypothetical protein
MLYSARPVLPAVVQLMCPCIIVYLFSDAMSRPVQLFAWLLFFRSNGTPYNISHHLDWLQYTSNTLNVVVASETMHVQPSR